MSEVDRLSNSGLYPMLPISDQKRGGNGGKNSQDPPANAVQPNAPKTSEPDSPRTPKSIIDEYA